MSTKQTPQGETSRIAVEEASAVVNGIPLVTFASFSIDVEDPSDRERSVDGNTVHFDQLLEPSGSCAVYPTSGAAPSFYETILSRQIGTVRYSYPDDDTRGAHSVRGVRFTNVSQEDLEAGGYTITADWQGDYFG